MKTRAEHREALGKIISATELGKLQDPEAYATVLNSMIAEDIAVSLRVIAEALHKNRTFWVEQKL